MPDTQLPLVMLDPGHGGHARAGRSSPEGLRGLRGTLEKDITLQLARVVARKLGGGVRLTREADVNLPIGERIERARRAGAGIFVSVHCGAPDRVARAYTHVYGSAQSRALAQSIAESLRGPSGHAGRAETGELAVLTPDRHMAHTAAVLLEVDDLSDEGGEDRLSDPGEIEALGQSIANGIRRFRASPAAARAMSVDESGAGADPTPEASTGGATEDAGLNAAIERELRSALDGDRLIDVMVQAAVPLVFSEEQSTPPTNYAGRGRRTGTRYGDGDPNDPPPARQATPADLVRALMAYEPINHGLHLLGDDAVLKFRSLSFGEKALLITWTIPIGAGVVYGVVSNRSLWAPGQSLLNDALNLGIHQAVTPDLNIKFDFVSPNHSFMVTFDLAPTLRRAGLPF